MLNTKKEAPNLLERFSMRKKMKNSKGSGSKYMSTQTRELSILALPAVILLIIFNYMPMGGLILAFKDYRFDKGILGSDWIGLKNFEFFFKSQDAWRITRNTVGYNLVFIITTIGGGVLLAIILSEVTKKVLVKIYQTTLFFPYFLSWPVVAYIAFAFLDQDLGLLNGLREFLGMQPIVWYAEPSKWPVIMVISALWKDIGYNTIIFYAGLMAFDTSLFEAAAIDGANKMQIIRKVTIPLMQPLIIMMTLLRLGKIFYADFGLFYMVTKDTGVLYPVVDVIDTYVYRSLRVVGDTGMASAVGFYQSVVGFILVILANWLVRKYNEDCALF